MVWGWRSVLRIRDAIALVVHEATNRWHETELIPRTHFRSSLPIGACSLLVFYLAVPRTISRPPSSRPWSVWWRCSRRARYDQRPADCGRQPQARRYLRVDREDLQRNRLVNCEHCRLPEHFPNVGQSHLMPARPQANRHLPANGRVYSIRTGDAKAPSITFMSSLRLGFARSFPL